MQKKIKMKSLVILSFSLLILSSCGVKIPYTTQLRDEFNLDTEEKMSKVQFFISGIIYLDEEKQSNNQNTTQNGTLVSSQSSSKESIIIPTNTRCVFDSFGPKGELLVRFETGEGKVIPFNTREGGSTSSKRFYFMPENTNSGSFVNYGSSRFKIRTNVTSDARNVYLMVVKKGLNKNKRKERVVKGMKV